jgi:hypothetical protein
MSLWHFRNVKKRYFNCVKFFNSRVYNLDALLATRVGSRITRIALYCLAFFFLIVLYIYFFNWEKIGKFPDQCNKYPNKLIQALTDGQHSFEQIKTNLKYLNISQSGTFIAPNKKFFSDEDKLAIVVPYRDREKNLRIFIEYMHQFLVMQNLTYQIFLVEPVRNLVFNRGLLLNVGYLEALKEMNFDCFVFHDVDMLPESLNNRYVCNKLWPTQMAISISIYKYMEAAPNYFRNLYTGGVTSYSRDIYRTINGYSNLFYGWGGEGSLKASNSEYRS